MSVTERSNEFQPSASGSATSDRSSISALLRLLGAGAPGSIILALGQGALRTKNLTTRVPGYAPRTVYRYVTRLAEIGAIEREEEPGVPSKVVHHLTDPAGIELCKLVDAYSQAALEALPTGGIVPHSWGSLTLLADLWETGMFTELNQGARTATELARAGHELSFHQVSRRINLYLISDMICESDAGARRRRYELTEEARQAGGLIAGLGRWRERHVLPAGATGITGPETAVVLRAALPLIALPEHTSKVIELTVIPPEGSDAEEVEVRAEVRSDGVVVPDTGAANRADGWGRGKVGDWAEALVQGAISQVRVGGDGLLIKACLRGVHEALWERKKEPPSSGQQIAAG